jgi:hypothetical protein
VTRDAPTPGSPSRGAQAPIAEAWALSASAIASTPSAHERVAPASAPGQGPDTPQTPSVPLGGSATASGGVFSSASFYAILVALGALALSQFGRLQLMPARWRCTAFIALLERPG